MRRVLARAAACCWQAPRKLGSGPSLDGSLARAKPLHGSSPPPAAGQGSMLVILKLPTGGMKNLELEGSDSIEAVRLQVAAQTQVHPEHQRLILMDGDVELTDGKKTVADYGIRLESEIRLAPRPPPRVVDLTVGGVRHTTLLSTLSQVEGSRLARMFDGLDPIDLAAAGAGGLPEGVPG